MSHLLSYLKGLRQAHPTWTAEKIVKKCERELKLMVRYIFTGKFSTCGPYVIPYST
ncbi:unnamed protein product [Amoebophrya sp. A120]|nr:unnamed protein product [Amoebophrya sp. A120]|eukprot:GSA120T00008715001.1